MAKLGYPGYGMYILWGNMLIMSPKESYIVPEDREIDEVINFFNNIEEVDEWVDHKINRSLLDGTRVGEDF